MGLTDTSKFLSLILRHKPETIGIKFHQSIKKDYFLRAGYMFIYQRIQRQQLRWAAGMESLWCIGWQPER